VVVRCQRERLGELLHVECKKLRRSPPPGPRSAASRDRARSGFRRVPLLIAGAVTAAAFIAVAK
jgi:hypothetical protein